METVEVVIRIPKELYEYMQTDKYDEHLERRFDYRTRFAIKDGTVLPKGHDALLDAGQLMDYCQNQIEGHKYVDCNVIARFPCVIKADKVEIEPQESENKE